MEMTTLFDYDGGRIFVKSELAVRKPHFSPADVLVCFDESKGRALKILMANMENKSGFGVDLTNLGMRDLSDAAKLVFYVDSYDPDETIPFIADLNSVLPNLNLDESTDYLRRLNRRLRSCGVEDLLDFASDVRYVYPAVKEDFDTAARYASVGMALEEKFGNAARTRYDRVVAAGVRSSINLRDAIKLGSIAAADENNFSRMAEILASLYGFDGKGSLFSSGYETAVRKYGLETAVGVFTPLYFETFRSADTLKCGIPDSEFVAKHIAPAISILEGKRISRDAMQFLAYHALGAGISGIGKNPSESWRYAGAVLDVYNRRENVERWTNSVKFYRQNKFSLSSAIDMADALEDYAGKNKDSYRIDVLNGLLRLQSNVLGISEQLIVANAVDAFHNQIQITE